MKHAVLATLLALGLSACGGGQSDRQVLIDACTAEQDMDQASCECLADNAEEQLDDELYGIMVQAARDGDEADMNSAMENLTPAQQGQLMGFVMTVATECSLPM